MANTMEQLNSVHPSAFTSSTEADSTLSHPGSLTSSTGTKVTFNPQIRGREIPEDNIGIAQTSLIGNLGGPLNTPAPAPIKNASSTLTGRAREAASGVIRKASKSKFLNNSVSFADRLSKNWNQLSTPKKVALLLALGLIIFGIAKAAGASYPLSITLALLPAALYGVATKAKTIYNNRKKPVQPQPQPQPKPEKIDIDLSNLNQGAIMGPTQMPRRGSVDFTQSRKSSRKPAQLRSQDI